jgi:hypothetical protein
VRNLRGWIGGLGGAAALTVGVVAAALIAAGSTVFHGGDSHISVPAAPKKLAIGSVEQIGAAASAASGSLTTSGSLGGRAVGRRQARAPRLPGVTGPVGEHRRGAPAPVRRPPGPSGGGSVTSTSPAPAPPVSRSPGPGGGGGGGPSPQPAPSLGGTVKNTTQQLGDTVNGATQAVGDTVSGVSPALGDTVKQTGPMVGNTVKGAGDLVGNTVDGLLGRPR